MSLSGMEQVKPKCIYSMARRRGYDRNKVFIVKAGKLGTELGLEAGNIRTKAEKLGRRDETRGRRQSRRNCRRQETELGTGKQDNCMRSSLKHCKLMGSRVYDLAEWKWQG